MYYSLALPAIDELTLFVTFKGVPLPEYVGWTTMENISENSSMPEPQRDI